MMSFLPTDYVNSIVIYEHEMQSVHRELLYDVLKLVSNFS